MSGGGDMGKSQQKNKTDQQQSSFGESASFIAPEQRGFLQQLWGQAAQAYPSMQDMATRYSRQSDDLYAQGQGLLSQLTGATGGMIDQVGEDINRQLQRQLGGAGGIDSQAAMMGGMGGGRNQVERGLAQEGALDAFGRQAAGLRLAGNESAMQALPGLQGLLGSGMTAQYGPLAALAELIGGPAILQQSRDQSQGTSRSRGSADQWNFGFGAKQ